MRKKTLLIKWTSLLLLVIIITYSGQLFPTVTVIAPTGILEIDKEKSSKSLGSKVTTVELQDGKLLRNDHDINLDNGQNLRKEVDVNLKSQMNYVPKNSRNVSHLHERGGNGREFESQPRIKNDVVKLNAEPKVPGAYDDIPKTFNEEYVRYFWKHPELYKNFLEFKKTLQTQEVDNKVSVSKKQETNGKADKLKTKSEQPTYITVNPPRGKLGNQMFQIASLLGIADMKHLYPILPFNEFNINRVFKQQQQFQPLSNIELKNCMRFTDDNKTIETVYDGIKRLDIHKNWTLDGYFQSFRYFQRIEDDVRQLFEFRDIYLTAARQFIHENVNAYHVKIAIHIRRQDFISSYQVKLGRVEVPADYVKNAQKYFQSKYKNITFIVVSDDLGWCHQHIQGKNVVFSTGKSIGTDLALMAECDHVIMSVGTFGWWGGWLSGGTVIYYKHYPRPGSYLDSNFNAKSYYPRHWIAME